VAFALFHFSVFVVGLRLLVTRGGKKRVWVAVEKRKCGVERGKAEEWDGGCTYAY